MELIRGLHNIKERHKGCVLTIGKFDGVHLGHVAVLNRLKKFADERNLPSVVMVFEPQPEELFMPDKAPARLSRLRDKYMLIEHLGIDRLLCVRFNKEFAQQPADFFIEHLLVEKLGIDFLVVGDDFRFGKNRTGDFQLLLDEGIKCGFDVVSTDSFRLKQGRVSSSAVRHALENNQLKEAEEMLGRPFSITGKVVHGDKLGRTIGFPTANVLLKRCKSPVSGVYAVNVKWGDTIWTGVANIGNRPTIKGQRAQLEVHIFDVKQDLYGEFIEVSLHHKIREEQRFDSFDSLRQQIERDSQSARDYFFG